MNDGDRLNVRLSTAAILLWWIERSNSTQSLHDMELWITKRKIIIKNIISTTINENSLNTLQRHYYTIELSCAWVDTSRVHELTRVVCMSWHESCAWVDTSRVQSHLEPWTTVSITVAYWNQLALGKEQVVSSIPGSVGYIPYPMFIEPTIT